MEKVVRIPRHKGIGKNRCMIGFLSLLFVINISAAEITPPVAAIASASPLATKAGLSILKQGGNAFDAAVAVASVLAVAEPFNSGLGGGGYWLIYRADKHQYQFIDSREVAPLAATSRMYLDKQGEVMEGASLNGPLAAAIPGEVAGMVYLAKHAGRLPLAVSLQPAITLAQQGVLVDKAYQAAAKRRLAALQAYPAAAQKFLTHGLIPEIGYRIKQPDLADVLIRIAAFGKKGFYKGPVAKKLVKGVRKAGGIWQLKDLKHYHVIIREPLIGHYKDATLILAPLSTAGGIGILDMLNILSGYDLSNMKKTTRIHFIVEAMRRAYADRMLLGDPRFVLVPVAELTSMNHAALQRASIAPEAATPSRLLKASNHLEGTQTTHFSILDDKGNRVAATLSLNNSFGSAFMPPGTGIVLNDQMDDFSVGQGPNLYGLAASGANQIEPQKRPLSSMSPTFVETPQGVAILGTPGGSRIPTMVLLAILDFIQGNLPDSWVRLPRYHLQFKPDILFYEKQALTQEDKNILQKHYTLQQVDEPYGNMQAIFWDVKQNKVYAASDPRGAGQALLSKKD